MCFAPYISLSTFVIEIMLAIFFLSKNPKDRLNRTLALVTLFLALYQLNEFLICVTGLTIFSQFARIITAILPVMGVSYTLVIIKKKISLIWNVLLYAPALFFTLMFLLAGYFETSTICSTVFIEFPNLGLLGHFFALYYLIYLSGSIVLFYFVSPKAISKYEKGLANLGMLGFLLFTIPTFIFLSFLPALQVQFPSVLCEFGLLLAIEFIVVLWYKDKHKLKY